MELQEIEKNAKALMTLHGVGRVPFAFDGGKRRLGACHWRRVDGIYLVQKVTLSRHYAVLLPKDEIRSVMLHEIAHVKAIEQGHTGHGHVWKRHALALGHTADRCAAPSARPEARVTAECPECFRPLAEQHRLPQRIYVCKVHRNRALTWMKDGVKVPVEEMPQKYYDRYRLAMEKGIIR